MPQDKYGRDEVNETVNEYVFRKMLDINEKPINLLDKHVTVDGLEEVPDGMLKISRSNPRNLNYTMNMNDMSYFAYHRNNGISKIGLVDEDSMSADVGKTTYIRRATEGVLSLSDKIS